MDNDQHVGSFNFLMRQKGYVGHFTLTVDATGQKMGGYLEHILHRYLHQLRESGKSEGGFTLHHLAQEGGRDKTISCEFVITYKAGEGFSVASLQTRAHWNNSSRHYRFTSNHEVPGRNAVIGSFPLPKPWDELAKGRPRFRRW